MATAHERRVGVAMDFSEGSKAALKWTVENVVRGGDYLILFMVVKTELEGKSQLWEQGGSPLIPLCDLGEGQILKGYGVTPDAEVVTLLEQVAREKNIVVVGKVYYGDPREKLCDAATDFPLSCMVVGSRGLGPLKRAILGSVSNYVVNTAQCPVTVVKH
ncbi:hypothetical protein SELMODRAFT_267677 [Selaginella moellendorffii]|uniref:UspA domain-containing protein n=1 Tax=Selaginella moellendorffii TaxID=88036 RepID=D8RRV6_SELML|nr:universal stress protein PHOS32 [Selaginella moellendorffii]XP_002983500.1 universal stress protein PHOS32 [Selaginella moellendorffii]EFJ15401.1 hypothetical protein SELMODRAFT_155902 [Selaginella moellendorffii]EFJ24950.1 hypothetical protein SELMODRAFT_267677 [Selaginella moellendorffii]|eukprot:XP_002973995.1 universal stress protein PHOS32 [Selaginella moellendorffii]